MSMNIDVDAAPSAVLKVLAEPLRWRIVELLAAEELCVCHLVETLEVPQPLVSHHLRVLREAGLVETSRLRHWTYSDCGPRRSRRSGTPSPPSPTPRRPPVIVAGRAVEPMTPTLGQRVTAEGVGTALLVAVVVGPGSSPSASPPTTRVCSCWRTPPLPPEDWSR